ncbi:hypothetical protein TorRG33x02_310840 [Trema orientale]|uniref:Uncharacterized protein n=1 Tax=Trema orientale TaxID=63057 RepID=A0A2P5BS76_TREOI|nr:hypothetical protein TorRG33x02_310840 [Trema orientale]
MRIRCIVVGFHSLAICEERDEEAEANQVFSTLRKIILKFGALPKAYELCSFSPFSLISFGLWVHTPVS